MKRFTLEQLVPDTINLLIPEQDGVCLKNFISASTKRTKGEFVMKGMMKVKLVIALLVVIAVAIFYYVSLPAINIHATETWKFIFLILAVLFVLYIVRKAKIAGQSKIELSFIKEYTGLKIGVIVFYCFGGLCGRLHFVLTDCQCSKISETFKSGRGGIYRGYQTDFL